MPTFVHDSLTIWKLDQSDFLVIKGYCLCCWCIN